MAPLSTYRDTKSYKNNSTWTTAELWSVSAHIRKERWSCRACRCRPTGGSPARRCSCAWNPVCHRCTCATQRGGQERGRAGESAREKGQHKASVADWAIPPNSPLWAKSPPIPSITPSELPRTSSISTMDAIFHYYPPACFSCPLPAASWIAERGLNSAEGCVERGISPFRRQRMEPARSSMLPIPPTDIPSRVLSHASTRMLQSQYLLSASCTRAWSPLASGESWSGRLFNLHGVWG